MKSFKSYKKGQAALEFLTTYGWAFLVILVAIGGLSYFGVFDMGRLLPEGCKLDTNLVCGDVYVLTGDSTNRFQVELKNTRDKYINITSIELYEKSLAEDIFDKHIAPCQAAPVVPRIDPGRTEDVDFAGLTNAATCGLDYSINSKKTFIMEVTYTVGTSSIQQVSSGEITTTVQ